MDFSISREYPDLPIGDLIPIHTNALHITVRIYIPLKNLHASLQLDRSCSSGRGLSEGSSPEGYERSRTNGRRHSERIDILAYAQKTSRGSRVKEIAQTNSSQ